ncbi:MAG TPA: DUF2116 family Zn-ribbon domain-containing protein [Clostridiales bacterium]|nr:DUF2116 family Zn-ribbon domain-containing protein [Clostridiales bacterium]
MKKCEYCGKEISYQQQYCDDVCEQTAKRYYRTMRNKGKLFSVINFCCLLGLIIAGFWAVLSPSEIPAFLAGVVLILMGLLYFLLPFGTPEQIKKRQIKNNVNMIKTIGIAVFVIGVILIGCGLFLF